MQILRKINFKIVLFLEIINNLLTKKKKEIKLIKKFDIFL